MRTDAVGALWTGRLAWGLTLVCAPGALLDATDDRDDPAARGVLRVLGARHVAQAVLTGRRPGRVALVLGVGADALHAATALGLALVDAGRRRSALLDAAAAGAWAASGAWCLSRTRRR